MLLEDTTFIRPLMNLPTSLLSLTDHFTTMLYFVKLEQFQEETKLLLLEKESQQLCFMIQIRMNDLKKNANFQTIVVIFLVLKFLICNHLSELGSCEHF